MSDRTYRASERYPFLASAVTIATLLAMGLVLAFMLSSVLQWRSDLRARADAATASRHDAARTVEVGALR
jgi:hypothetical protein